MSAVDFTRWNRAGRSRFRYVDGNAVTHLEDLRNQLQQRFPEWLALQDDGVPDETSAERLARLLAQYQAPRRDWAWETSRSFARALHILTDYADAYANEGYLKTATQWEHVRRLVDMIGYTPKPAASAQTKLVLLAKPKVTKATVARGFQVNHTPEDGSPPVIFETLDDLVVDQRLNELHVKGWRFNPRVFKTVFASLKERAGDQWQTSEPGMLRSGDFAILIDEAKQDKEQLASLTPVRVAEVSKKSVEFSIAELNSSAFRKSKDLKLSKKQGLPLIGHTHLLAAARSVETPMLHGNNSVRVGDKHGRVAGDVIAWQIDGAEPTFFAKVIETDSQSLALEPAEGVALPRPDTTLYAARTISRAQFQTNSNQWRIPLAKDMPRSDAFAVTFFAPSGKIDAGFPIAGNFTDPTMEVDSKTVDRGYSRIHKNKVGGAKSIWIADPGNDEKFATRLAAPAPNELVFEGTAPNIKSGDPLLLSGGKFFEAAQVKDIVQSKGEYTIVLTAEPKMDRVRAVYCDFEYDISPVDRFYDPTRMSNNVIDLSLSDAANPLLTIGRQLVLSSRSDRVETVTASIVGVNRKTGNFSLDADPKHIRPFKRGDLNIYANAVLAGHGETKPLKVLGSGNAAANHQELVLDYDDVAHVADPTLPGGVRADLIIRIEQEIYRQVPSFRDSEPGDAHYTVKTTETGALLIRFGDGRNGRRLPTSRDNILLSYRRGAGLAGNLPKFSLDTIAIPHAAIDDVRQPALSSGGDEREVIEHIRSNAPGRLKALDRAISTQDFENLASGFTGVWHAAAFQLAPEGRTADGVDVVLVPAGGGALGPLGDTVHTYLKANSLPDVAIHITPYEDVPVALDVTLRVESARFDPAETREAAIAALLSDLDLRVRRPGKSLYRSALIHTVENVVGVSNSHVRLFPGIRAGRQAPWRRASFGDDGGIWRVQAYNHQVLHAQDPALISVSVEEAAG